MTKTVAEKTVPQGSPLKRTAKRKASARSPRKMARALKTSQSPTMSMSPVPAPVFEANENDSGDTMDLLESLLQQPSLVTTTPELKRQSTMLVATPGGHGPSQGTDADGASEATACAGPQLQEDCVARWASRCRRRPSGLRRRLSRATRR